MSSMRQVLLLNSALARGLYQLRMKWGSVVKMVLRGVGLQYHARSSSAMSRGPKSMKSVFRFTMTKYMDKKGLQSEIWAFCCPTRVIEWVGKLPAIWELVSLR